MPVISALRIMKLENQKFKPRARDMAELLRVSSAFPDDWSLILSTHMVA